MDFCFNNFFFYFKKLQKIYSMVLNVILTLYLLNIIIQGESLTVLSLSKKFKQRETRNRVIITVFCPRTGGRACVQYLNLNANISL